MKLAIMQPYFMPYLSYFKLIKLVDRFVVLDDVNFIKKGWINRNYILINNNSHLFTLPVQSLSQNKKINELSFLVENKWRANFLKTIQQSYRRSPQYDNFFPLLEKIVNFQNNNLSKYIGNSIFSICDYLKIKTDIIFSSSNFLNQELTGESRILDICYKNHCTEYYNLPGGRDLYNFENFKKTGITLKFLEENFVSYKQFQGTNVSNFSIIDYLMFNDPVQFNGHCGLY